MNLKNKNILVTGGSGFIGSNLIKRLQIEGAKVDNFDTSQGKNINDQERIETYVKRGYEVIYHLAGFSGSSESSTKKQLCFKINTIGTLNILENISKYSPQTKIIFSSSRLEYGIPKYLPVDENHPTKPTSIYGLSKLTATQLALMYSAKSNLNVTIFRSSNVYGHHSIIEFKGYNLINHYIDLAKANKKLTIFGNGEQMRDYIFIDDLVDAFILAATNDTSSKIYNLGLGEGIKLKDMVALIIKKVGTGRMEFVKWPESYKSVETGSYVTNIAKIKKDLGFLPKIGFEKGIEITLNNLK